MGKQIKHNKQTETKHLTREQAQAKRSEFTLSSFHDYNYTWRLFYVKALNVGYFGEEGLHQEQHFEDYIQASHHFHQLRADWFEQNRKQQ